MDIFSHFEKCVTLYFQNDLEDDYKFLYSFVEKNRSKGIELALKELNLNVNHQNTIGNTALHLAVERAHKESVELLLKYGADATLPNDEGKTPLNLIEDQLNKRPFDTKLIQINDCLRNQSGTSTGTLFRPRKRTYSSTSYNPGNLKRNLPGTSTGMFLRPEKRKYSPTSCNPAHLSKYRKAINHGFIFQFKLLMLFVQRARERCYKFRLTTEMDAADKFDDVVFEYTVGDEKLRSFLQVKHKCDAMITSDDLESVSNQFPITTYFQSFIKIKNERGGKMDFVKDFKVVTNANFDLDRYPGDRYFKSGEVWPIVKTEMENKRVEKWKSLCTEDTLNQDEMLRGYKVKTHKFRADADEESWQMLKFFLKQSLLVDALKLKQIPKFPKIRDEIKRREEKFKQSFEEFIEINANESYKNQEKAGKANDFKEEVQKLTETMAEFKEFTKLIRNNEDVEGLDVFVLNVNEEKLKTKIEEIMSENPKIKTVKDLDKKFRATISDISIIIASLDDGSFEKYFMEFVQKFRFVTNFPNEFRNEFAHNQSKLSKTFDLLNGDLVTASFEKKMLEILKGYNDRKNVFLTDKVAFEFLDEVCKKIDVLLNSGLSMAYPGELNAYNISFDEQSECFSKFSKKLNDFTTSESQDNNVLLLYTHSTLLSSIKVLQFLKSHVTYRNSDSFIFIRLKTWDALKTALDRNDCPHLLVIDFDDNDDEFGRISFQETLSKTIESKKNKKFILISRNILLYSWNMERLTDETSFKDLTIKSQIDVLEKKVDFQGETMSLNRLIDMEFATKFLDKASLTGILKESKVYIGNEDAFDSNGYEVDYYVDRTFRRQKIKCDILKRHNQLLFITVAKDEYSNETQEELDELIEYWTEEMVDKNVTSDKNLKAKIEQYLSCLQVFSFDLKENLIKLGVRQERIVQWKENTKYENGQIIIPSSEQNEKCYLEMYQTLRGNAHWLELHRGTNLFWKMSMGNFKVIIDNIEKEFIPRQIELFHILNEYHETKIFPGGVDILDEQHLYNLDTVQKLVMIASDAGMGKSTVLTSIAKKMKESNKNDETDRVKWIVRINMNDYVKDFHGNEFSVDNAIDLISTIVIPSKSEMEIDIEIQRRLFMFCLKKTQNKSGVNLKKPKIILMFDGFDEICPKFKSKATNLLKALMKSDVAQVWLTTRVHEKDHLEKELRSIAYNLNPLTKYDQEKFLDRFWKWKLKKMTNDEIRQYLANVDVNENTAQLRNSIKNIHLFDDAEKCISNLDFDLCHFLVLQKWRTDILNESFIMVPLQAQMLADAVFEMQFQMPEALSISNLYEKFIDIKFNIYFNQKVKQSSSVYNSEAFCIRQSVLEYFYRLYTHLAVDFLFPGEPLPGKEQRNGKLESYKKELLNTDILIPNTNKIEFVHRSFAEYFFSRYLIGNKGDEQVQKLLLNKILVCPEYRIICQFFTDGLKRLSEREKQIIFTNNAIESIPMNIRFGDQTFFTKCASDGPQEICVSFLKSIQYDSDLHKEIVKKLILSPFNINSLANAVFNNYEPLIDGIMKFMEKHSDIREEFIYRCGSLLLCTIAIEEYRMEYGEMIRILTEKIMDEQVLEDLIVTSVYSLLYDKISINGIFLRLSKILKLEPKLHAHLKRIENTFKDIRPKKDALFRQIYNGWGDDAVLSISNNMTSRLEMKHLLLSFDVKSKTIFHRAVEHNWNNIIQKILENVQDFSKLFAFEFFSKRYRRGTVLHFVVTKGDKQTLKTLLNCAKSFSDEELLIQLLLTKNCYDKSAIEMACYLKKDDIVQEILTFARENLPDDITENIEKSTVNEIHLDCYSSSYPEEESSSDFDSDSESIATD